jgi:hypothetical protein
VTLNEKIRKTKERLYSEYGRRRASRIKKDDRTAKKKKTGRNKKAMQRKLGNYLQLQS